MGWHPTFTVQRIVGKPRWRHPAAPPYPRVRHHVEPLVFRTTGPSPRIGFPRPPWSSGLDILGYSYPWPADEAGPTPREGETEADRRARYNVLAEDARRLGLSFDDYCERFRIDPAETYFGDVREGRLYDRAKHELPLFDGTARSDLVGDGVAPVTDRRHVRAVMDTEAEDEGGITDANHRVAVLLHGLVDSDFGHTRTDMDLERGVHVLVAILAAGSVARWRRQAGLDPRTATRWYHEARASVLSGLSPAVAADVESVFPEKLPRGRKPEIGRSTVDVGKGSTASPEPIPLFPPRSGAA